MRCLLDAKKLPDLLRKVNVGVVYDVSRQAVIARAVRAVRAATGHGSVPVPGKFYGFVWFEDGEFWMEVWIKGFVVGTYHGLTPDEIVREALDDHGRG